MFVYQRVFHDIAPLLSFVYIVYIFGRHISLIGPAPETCFAGQVTRKIYDDSVKVAISDVRGWVVGWDLMVSDPQNIPKSSKVRHVKNRETNDLEVLQSQEIP